MKPYQALLALMGYYLLQIYVASSISLDYYMVISLPIALIAFGWLLHKKQMLHMSSRDLKGSQLFFCLGIGLGLALFSKISVVLGVLSGAPVLEMLLPDGFLWIPTVTRRRKGLFRCITGGKRKLCTWGLHLPWTQRWNLPDSLLINSLGRKKLKAAAFIWALMPRLPCRFCHRTFCRHSGLWMNIFWKMRLSFRKFLSKRAWATSSLCA